MSADSGPGSDRSPALEVDPAHAALLAASGIATYDDLAASPRLALWKRKRDRAIHTLALADPARPGASRTLYVKVHERREGLRDRLLRLLGRAPVSEARRERDAALALAAAGIPVPAPVAIGERRRGGLLESVHATEELTGFVQLEALVRGPLRDAARDPALAREARGLALAVAALARRLHGAGFAHRDLYLTHVLVSEARRGAAASGGPPLAAPDLRLIDLQRVFRPRALAARWRVKDLAALAHSTPASSLGRSGRLRFLRAYLGLPARGRLAPGDRALVRRLAGAVQRKAARIARHAARMRARRLEAQAARAIPGVAALRCRAAPGEEGRLPALLDGLSEGRFPLRKRGQGRLVRDALLPCGARLLVKVFLPPRTLAGRLRALARPSPVTVERRAALALLARGVPTPRPLAWGRARGACAGGAGFLALERIEPSRTLREVADGGLPEGPARRALASALAALLRRAHDAGVHHGDLHPGNILVAPGAPETPADAAGAPRPRLLLIDLRSVRLSGPLDPAVRLLEIARLDAFFRSRARLAERLRFLRDALGPETVAALGGLRAAARRADALAQARIRLEWRQKARKCLRASAAAAPVRTDRIVGYARTGILARADVAGWIERALAARPEGDGAAPPVRLLKASRGTRTALVADPAGDVVVKVYLRRGPLDALRDLLRGPRAVRAWRACWALEARDVPSPRALAAVSLLGREGPPVSALLLERVPGEDLVRLASRLDPRARRRAALDLARVVARLHGTGLEHGDLKAANILGREDGRGGFAFSVIDADGLRARRAPLGEAARARDLACLASRFVAGPARLSSALRLRFLAALGLDRGARRRTWGLVARLLARRRERTRAPAQPGPSTSQNGAS